MEIVNTLAEGASLGNNQHFSAISRTVQVRIKQLCA